MIQKKVRILGMLSAMLCCGAVSAQQHEVEMIPFGNMDQWIDRQIKESGIIGGATKNVYAIGPTATVTETKASKCERHISTQQSIANYECARAWYDLGAKRVVLAREVSLQEIREMRAKIPEELEVET